MSSGSAGLSTSAVEPGVPASAAGRHAAFAAPGWLPAASLAWREIVRFFRQRTRVIGALGQPLLFWILFGAGLQGSFRGPGGESYQEYFYPGVAVMIVMFTAIYSTISIIEDRREGFLQGVLVSPAPRWSIVAGKVSGGAAIALLQTMLFLWIGPLLHVLGLAPELHTGVSWQNVVPVVAWLAVLGVTLTALGYCFAWPMESTHGFHALMSVVLLPMWLLAGTFFPAGNAGWLSWVIRLNPLTYATAGLRRLLASRAESVADLPGWPVCLLVTGLFCGVCLTVAVALTERRTVLNVR
jgi:ABC-2 type transport system permease protein